MAKQSISPAEFLRVLDGGMSPGTLIELRAIPTSRTLGSIQRWWTRADDDLEQLIGHYGFRGSAWGLYFGVCRRSQDLKGTKEFCAPATTLWADIDCITNGQDIDATAELVMKLPTNLQPSAMIKSGGGLHLYWLLQESPATQQETEHGNRLLGHIVGGDNVGDVARVMRLPGTYNNKRAYKAKCEIVFLRQHIRYDFYELTNAADGFGKMIQGDRLGPKKIASTAPSTPVMINRNIVNHLTYRNGISLTKKLEDLWRNRVREHAPRGYMGIHEALITTVARLHCSMPDAKDEAIVARVFNEFLPLVPGVDLSRWNMRQEQEKIAKALETWKQKWPALRKSLRNEQSGKSR